MTDQSIDSNIGNKKRPNNLSETRKNQTIQNFRSAGEQAILRNSSNNRAQVPTDGVVQMEKPGLNNASRLSNQGPAASKPPMAGATAKNASQSVVTLEPIENYKGKSLEELEAILDAYNAQKQPAVVKHNVADEEKMM